MNTQLIPVFAGEISGTSVQLADARLLHSFLEIARDFSTWIKSRIEEYNFVENLDFLVHQNGGTKTGRGGNRKTVFEYHLTLDMAKELSMVERNEKGKIARRYFIDCERHLLQAPSQCIEAPIYPPMNNAINISLNGWVSMMTLIFEGKADTHGRYFVDVFDKAVSITALNHDEMCLTFEQWVKYARQERGYVVMKKQDLLDRLV